MRGGAVLMTCALLGCTAPAKGLEGPIHGSVPDLQSGSRLRAKTLVTEDGAPGCENQTPIAELTFLEEAECC